MLSVVPPLSVSVFSVVPPLFVSVLSVVPPLFVSVLSVVPPLSVSVFSVVSPLFVSVLSVISGIGSVLGTSEKSKSGSVILKSVPKSYSPLFAIIMFTTLVSSSSVTVSMPNIIRSRFSYGIRILLISAFISSSVGSVVPFLSVISSFKLLLICS